jgi:alpha-methylacyl-CoA racemase
VHDQAGDGPLSGLRVVELPAIGPVPFAAMLLADLGADVIRVDRPEDVGSDPSDPLARVYAGLDPTGRSRRRVAIDLKSPEGIDVALRIADRSDVLLEGFRPGVAERLGLGPNVCTERNPALIYARMTGWGQAGPLASAVGHDINYVALAGVLDSIGHDGGPPVAPLGYLGDFGGGGLFLAFGVLAAAEERHRSGRGQVVDTAVVDGVGLLGSVQRYLRLSGAMPSPRGTNGLDGGHPAYRVYETADDQWVSFGAVEPRFQAELADRLGVNAAEWDDPACWPASRQRVADLIRSRTRAEWVEILDGADACFAPVLTHEQTMLHPHHQARRAFIDVAGESQVAPGPRFDRTPARHPRPAPAPGEQGNDVLSSLGWAASEVDELVRNGAITLPHL